MVVVLVNFAIALIAILKDHARHGLVYGPLQCNALTYVKTLISAHRPSVAKLRLLTCKLYHRYNGLELAYRQSGKSLEIQIHAHMA